MEKNSLLYFSGTVEVQKMFLFIDWSKGQFLRKLNQCNNWIQNAKENRTICLHCKKCHILNKQNFSHNWTKWINCYNNNMTKREYISMTRGQWDDCSQFGKWPTSLSRPKGLDREVSHLPQLRTTISKSTCHRTCNTTVCVFNWIQHFRDTFSCYRIIN